MPISVILMIIGAICSVGTLAYISHRQWISVWRGHRIRIRLHQLKIIVEIDDEPVLVESQGIIHRPYHTEWNHPALGKKIITVKRTQKGQEGVNVSLEIGDEIIPLFELPVNWLQQVQLEKEESYWEKLTPVDFEQLGDPRWIAACKLLQLIRQSKMANKEIRETANTLQLQLRKNFETRRRISEEDVSLLGCIEDLNQIKAKIEERIQQGLEAVKSLHMVTISLEAHADEKSELERVYQTIQYLQAEDEVAAFVAAPLSDKKKQNQLRSIKKEQ